LRDEEGLVYWRPGGREAVIDIAKRVKYWRGGAAKDDLESAQVLVAAGKTRQGLFFAHLAIEKALKAHVCRLQGVVPPRSHDLLRLAREAQLEVTPAQAAVPKLAMRHCLEGRYPENWPESPARDEADQMLKDVCEVVQWLLSGS
jgi:HEPN domain-containing protein